MVLSGRKILLLRWRTRRNRGTLGGVMNWWVRIGGGIILVLLLFTRKIAIPENVDVMQIWYEQSFVTLFIIIGWIWICWRWIK